MNRLQTRLLLAFIVVLLITLSVIGAALMVFLATRPVPVDSTINNLTGVLLDINLRRLSEEQPNRLEAQKQLLDQIAQETNTRLLVINENQRVLYDTDQRYTLDELIQIPQRDPLIGERPRPTFTTGRFEENGESWIFVARREVGAILPGNRLELLAAVPAPRPTPRYVIQNFGRSFLTPLCQAGSLGLLVAFILSAWLARSVAHPLQAIAQAAQKVSAGDYDQKVPEAGPTEARVVAHAFNDMTHQVKQNQQAQHDFLANVAHELRTPLTSIQGFSQAIMDGVAVQPEAAHHAASVIYEETGRLSRLVNELLDLARLQSGEMAMHWEAVEIDRLLQMVGENLSLRARGKNIDLQVAIPPLMRIKGDGDRLAQIFTNLLDNAITHTPAGGCIWLKANLDKQGVLVQIQDSGEGITTEDLSRIFERFYQVDKSRNRDPDKKGVGLGLAITAQLVQAHGGRISVESQVGVGTRFNVWLPALAPTPKP